MKLLNFLLYLIIVLLQHFSKTRVNLFIVNEINLWSKIKGDDFACGNSLFGTVKLTKNADSDKYKYSCYGNGRKFSKNVIIFAADLSWLVHADNKKKDNFNLGKDPIDDLYKAAP